MNKIEGRILVFGGNGDIGKLVPGIKIPREQVNVTNYLEVKRCIHSHRPSAVVDCAGVSFPQPIKSCNVGKWCNEINTNFIGSFNIASASIENEVSKMVFISSYAGLHGKAKRSGYCASKAGVISLVQSIAEEGHEVYCISPSRVDTKMVGPPEKGEDMTKRLRPQEIVDLIGECLNGVYKSGSNIVIRKNGDKTVKVVM